MEKEKKIKSPETGSKKAEPPKKNRCCLCRFCRHNDRAHGFACHNEESRHFGAKLDKNHLDTMCEDFVGHVHNMPLKEALRIVTAPSSKGFLFHDRLPENMEDDAFVCRLFETNGAKEEWMDAFMALFAEYMELAKKDGDFT